MTPEAPPKRLLRHILLVLGSPRGVAAFGPSNNAAKPAHGETSPYMRRQIPLALGGIPVSPSWPGLTSKTGLGLEPEHRLRLTGSLVRRPVGARGLKTAPGAPVEGSESVPRGLQAAPRSFEEAPGVFPEAYGRPQERSTKLPDASKSMSGGLRTLQEVSRPLGEHSSRLHR